MKFYLLVILGVLSFFTISYAQPDFKEGYVIKKTGDTVFGKIDYRGDFIMGKHCRFKSNDTVIDYKPDDISAFRFLDNKFFISKKVNNSNVFLEFLIKGKLCVYYLRDEKGDHYYIEKENEQLKELPYKEGIEIKDGKQYFSRTTKHNGILTHYTKEAPSLQTEIETIKEPEHKSLIKLAESYNNIVCKDEKCIIYKKSESLLDVMIEPFVGIVKYNRIDKFSNQFGCHFYLWSPRANEKIFFKTGLIYDNISNSEQVPLGGQGKWLF